MSSFRSAGGLGMEVVDLYSAAGFALIQRAAEPRTIELVVGTPMVLDQISDIPPAGPHSPVLVAMPFRQIRERGYDCIDDGCPLIAIVDTTSDRFDREELPPPTDAGSIEWKGFDRDDAQYADMVSEIISRDIALGEGSNFVIRRCLEGRLTQSTHIDAGYRIFHRLLSHEANADWVYLINTGDSILVGASPEEHVVCQDGWVRMNPISGTYHYPEGGPTVRGLRQFLDDAKERQELFMVVDEELKMLSQVCDPGLRVTGPRLRGMAHLAHSEYVLEGPTRADIRTVLRQTMFAPTIIGSPIQNACRVITRYESRGRRYYGGAIAHLSLGPDHRERLDSVVVIRSAEIHPDGAVAVDVGATLVRDSRPHDEVTETRSKSAALVQAMSSGRAIGRSAPSLPEDPDLTELLESRNLGLSRFWRGGDVALPDHLPPWIGPLLVVDGEDLFTGMLMHQLAALGLEAEVRSWEHVTAPDLTDWAWVLLGPGPGDPLDRSDPRVRRMHDLAERALSDRIPLIGECLSHQLVCHLLGMPVRRRPAPRQGAQEVIDLFGEEQIVGFYNSFAAWYPDTTLSGVAGTQVEVARDPVTHEVAALRADALATCQFHLESVLTHEGSSLLLSMLDHVSHRAAPSEMSGRP